MPLRSLSYCTAGSKACTSSSSRPKAPGRCLNWTFAAGWAGSRLQNEVESKRVRHGVKGMPAGLWRQANWVSTQCSTTAWPPAGCRAAAGWWWGGRTPRQGTSCCPAACTSRPAWPPAEDPQKFHKRAMSTVPHRPASLLQRCDVQGRRKYFNRAQRRAHCEGLLSKSIKHEGDQRKEDDTEVLIACTSTGTSGEDTVGLALGREKPEHCKVGQCSTI